MVVGGNGCKMEMRLKNSGKKKALKCTDNKVTTR